MPKKDKSNNPACNDDMKLEECELVILRNAVDENESIQKKLKNENFKNSEDFAKIFAILEDFIIKKRLILYGGFAINAVLPEYAQFYDKNVDIPDYDCYSPTAMEDAVELSNIYYNKGYTEVEARAGVHFGTYKVYVNFNGIADISQLDKNIFYSIQKESIKLNKILYCPVNFLRRNMYLELSQPLGEVTRWEKVLTRLNILNKYYPLDVDYKCNDIEINKKTELNIIDNEKIYTTVREAFIFMGAIFFGGYACKLYSQHMHKSKLINNFIDNIPIFDVIYDDIDKASNIIQEKLNYIGFKNIKIIKHNNIGEIIPIHYEIRVNNKVIAFIYQPLACHSYNTITINDVNVNVATIETILMYYFSFYYSNLPYYYRDRILCMAKIFFDVQQENRIEQKGILKRFTVGCIGKQDTMDDIRKKKTDKFKELINKKNSREYLLWFLKYNPALDDSKMKIRNIIKNRIKLTNHSLKHKQPKLLKNQSNILSRRKTRKQLDKKNIFGWKNE